MRKEFDTQNQSLSIESYSTGSIAPPHPEQNLELLAISFPQMVQNIILISSKLSLS